MSFVFVLTKKYTKCTKSSYKAPSDAWGETKVRWFVLVFSTTNSFKGVLMDNVFALAVKNTRSTESSYTATNALGDASKYKRQCGSCWRFQPRSPSEVCSGTMASLSWREYAHGQWLRFRCEEHKVHGVTVALQQKARNDAGKEPEAMWPVLALSHPRNECDSGVDQH